jgi:hypothetical protein
MRISESGLSARVFTSKARLSGSNPPSALADTNTEFGNRFAMRSSSGSRVSIDLVEDVEHGPLVRTELIEDSVHDMTLLLPLRMAGVDHVQQQIGLPYFLERRAERGNEMVRQLADEADGIREQHVIVFAEVDFPR